MNFDDFLSDRSEDDRHTMTEKELVAALKRCASAIAEPSVPFAHGDVLLHKFPDLAMSRTANEPCIFIGYLEQPITVSESTRVSEPWDWFSNSAAVTLDCRIGIINGDTFSIYFAASNQYRLHPDYLTGGRH